MISDHFFVWIYLPQSISPVLTGRIDFSVANGKKIGHFVYGKSFLERKDAISIDPVALPLNSSAFAFTTLNGLPGVIADSCPDKWGIRVIDQMDGEAKSIDFPLGYLLMNDPGRVGALAYSRSAAQVPIELVGRQFDLKVLLHAAQDIELNKIVDSEILRALHPGTGGARPKCNVVDEDGVWLAKFPSSADAVVSNPKLEHATMSLAKACGLNVATTRIEVVDGFDVCLVKRFDREVVGDQIYRKSFLSARSVFYDDPGFAQIGFGSYGRLARWLPKYGCDQSDKTELYRRMVFNVAVRNSDDHELNHGLICGADGQFSLSPAYDIVPSLHLNRVQKHALLIGENANGTIESLLENAKAFDLSPVEAISIINNIQLTIKNNWVDVFYEAGFGDDEIRLIEKCFAPIPERLLAVAPNCVLDGSYNGPIVEVDDGVVLQKIGRDPDKVVRHDCSKLSRIPKINEIVDIKYKNGLGKVSDRAIEIAQER